MTSEQALAIVRAVRADFDGADPGIERGFRVTNRSVQRLNDYELRHGGPANFGLLYKPAGTNWHERSIDCIMRRTGETWDILGDAEGAARPQWERTKPTGMTNTSKWRAAEWEDTPLPQPEPPPVPLPLPEPEPLPPGSVEATLAAIRRDVQTALRDLSIIRATVTDILMRVEGGDR